MGCCSSRISEPPSITCTDDILVRQFETNAQRISPNSLLLLLDRLNHQSSDQNRLEIIKEITNQKFVLNDFDAILECFTTSNGKLSATRILKKNLIGTEYNSGFLIKHFTNHQEISSLNSINSTSPSDQLLIPNNSLTDDKENIQQSAQYT